LTPAAVDGPISGAINAGAGVAGAGIGAVGCTNISIAAAGAVQCARGAGSGAVEGLRLVRIEGSTRARSRAKSGWIRGGLQSPNHRRLRRGIARRLRGDDVTEAS